jgi:hypothetical protein
VYWLKKSAKARDVGAYMTQTDDKINFVNWRIQINPSQYSQSLPSISRSGNLAEVQDSKMRRQIVWDSNNICVVPQSFTVNAIKIMTKMKIERKRQPKGLLLVHLLMNSLSN